MKHVPYPSIEQFRNCVHAVRQRARYVGKDNDGNAIYDNTVPLPTIHFYGTVKLHGTNAGVSYNRVDGIWAQSRERIITPEKDNAGFASYVHTHREDFKLMFEQQWADYFDNGYTITVFGEWCGQGVQKCVAISELPKTFFVFGAKVSRDDNPQFIPHWITHEDFNNPAIRVYNVESFDTYEVAIDFSMPELVQNKLAELTERVEAQCPVAAHFGIGGIGEGVVWNGEHNGETYRFKVKGEKHSASKVKTLAPVDCERFESIREFARSVVTDARFEQAMMGIFGRCDAPDRTKIGDFLRWFVNDVIKEESDTLAANGLEPKDVNKYVSELARKKFFEAESASL